MNETDIAEERASFKRATDLADGILGAIPSFVVANAADLGAVMFVIWCKMTNELVASGWDRDELASHVVSLGVGWRHDA